MDGAGLEGDTVNAAQRDYTSWLHKSIPRTERSLTQKQVAKLLGVSPQLIQYWGWKWKRFPVHVCGKSWAILPSELRRWLYEDLEGVQFVHWLQAKGRWHEPDWNAL